MADAIVGDLIDLFPDTVLVEPRPNQPDGYGLRETPTSALSIPAFVTGRQAMVRTAGGQMQASSVRAVLAGAYGVTVRDKFTLPERFVPRSPEAIAVVRSTDENGAHHETVYFP